MMVLCGLCQSCVSFSNAKKLGEVKALTTELVGA